MHAPTSSVSCRAMTAEDGPAVLAIYAEGVATGHATFETDAPAWEVWDEDHLAAPRIVAVDDAGVTGWAALAPVSGRCVYGGVGEVSVYVAGRARGRGVGRALLDRLVAASEEEGLWSLRAGVFPENEASLKLHQAAGFRRVGVHERIGRMRAGPLAGEWRDVVLLERRSAVAGV